MYLRKLTLITSAIVTVITLVELATSIPNGCFDINFYDWWEAAQKGEKNAEHMIEGKIEYNGNSDPCRFLRVPGTLGPKMKKTTWQSTCDDLVPDENNLTFDQDGTSAFEIPFTNTATDDAAKASLPAFIMTAAMAGGTAIYDNTKSTTETWQVWTATKYLGALPIASPTKSPT